MSSYNRIQRITVPDILARKGGTPIVCLTSYHAHTARLIDPYVDMLLVGDSLGMVMHGMENTLGVSLDLMIMHGKAVVRGADRALVAVDMPFGSYEESPAVAFRNAARVLQETGCTAVKLEGGHRMAETIYYLSERGIPVMAHIGMTPQSIQMMGGFKTQGLRREDWPEIEEDALAVAEAGAFAVVLEALAEPLAVKITKNIPIPTIGIGASVKCDGQILVTEDILGLSPNPPKFVKEYASLAGQISGAAEAFANEVRRREFPSSAHTYALKEKG